MPTLSNFAKSTEEIRDSSSPEVSETPCSLGLMHQDGNTELSLRTNNVKRQVREDLRLLLQAATQRSRKEEEDGRETLRDDMVQNDHDPSQHHSLHGSDVEEADHPTINTIPKGPIHLGMLFPTDNPNSCKILETAGDFSKGCSSTLILGPKQSGKTSLLMQYAVAMASKPTHASTDSQPHSQINFFPSPSPPPKPHVLFISPSKEKLYARRPCLSRRPTGKRIWVPGKEPSGWKPDPPSNSSKCAHPPSDLIDPPPEVLSRIHIRYPQNETQLRKLLSSLPTTEPAVGGTPEPPCCIIVDDFSHFFGKEGKASHRIQLTLALLRDTTAHLRRSADFDHPSSQCHFVIADGTDEAQAQVLCGGETRVKPLFEMYATQVQWVFSIFGISPAFTMQISASTSFRSSDIQELRIFESQKLGTPLSQLGLPYPEHAGVDDEQVTADISVGLETVSIDFEIVDKSAIELNQITLL
ncbi:hypothetical protein HDU97_000043 [Phlyctochytrium planicorne]|nr:hypothetical protein HDU97_000043 [Phlyctochytrium planicorne]